MPFHTRHRHAHEVRVYEDAYAWQHYHGTSCCSPRREKRMIKIDAQVGNNFSSIKANLSRHADLVRTRYSSFHAICISSFLHFSSSMDRRE